MQETPVGHFARNTVTSKQNHTWLAQLYITIDQAIKETIDQYKESLDNKFEVKQQLRIVCVEQARGHFARNLVTSKQIHADKFEQNKFKVTTANKPV